MVKATPPRSKILGQRIQFTVLGIVCLCIAAYSSMH